MKKRLEEHIVRRIRDKSKHDHWCIHWIKKNLPVSIVIMMLYDHVKHDLQCLDEDATILCQPKNFLMVSNVEANLQGAYLYYDHNNEVWIRSGKVTGRGFTVRHK